MFISFSSSLPSISVPQLLDLFFNLLCCFSFHLLFPCFHCSILGNPMIFSAMVMSIEHPWDTVVLYCEKIHTFGALGPFLQFCLHADKAYHCRLINALHLKRTLQQNALPGPHGDSFGDLGPLFMIWVRFFSILDYYQKGIVKISFCPRFKNLY